MLAHRRQFILGPHRKFEGDGWLAHQLGSLVLSYCPDLPIRPHKDGVIVGLVIGPHLAGRWAFLSEACCHSDVSGLLGLNYRMLDDLWISSSPVILGKCLAPEAERINWKVDHGVGMDWIPAPFTSRRGVHKLLPLRQIHPVSGDIAPQTLDADDPTVSLGDVLSNTLAAWSELPDAKLALTAGLDSRTLLACSEGVDTFTFDVAHIATADRAIPPKLAAARGVAHTLIRPLACPIAETERRTALILEQMDDLLIHPLSLSWAQGVFDNGPLHSANGAIFEIGQCYYWNKLSSHIPDADGLMDSFFNSPPEPIEEWRAALAVWLGSLAEPIALDMDWRDRFYIEQRLGAWACQTQLAGDLHRTTRTQIANSVQAIQKLLAPPPEERRKASQQHALLGSLSHFPINQKSLADRAKSLTRRMTRTLRNFRNMRTI